MKREKDFFEDTEEQPEKKHKKKKSGKKSSAVTVAVIIAVVLLAVAICLYFFVLKNMLAYNKAGELFNAGNYAEAKTAYTALGSYEDSAEMVKKCDYRTACALFSQGKVQEAETLFLALGDFYDSRAWAENCRASINAGNYNTAVTLMNAGDSEGAKALFISLGAYEDSEAMVTECERRQGIALMESGAYEEAEAVFAAIAEYSDCKDLIRECEYQQALTLYTAGDTEGAYARFEALNGYKDSAAYMAKISAAEEPEVPEEPEAPEATEEPSPYAAVNWSVGSIVTFGNYAQTQTGKDRSPIEWLVLEKNGSKVLLLSRYGLDAQQFYTKARNVTWETCFAREWLNDVFIYKAFTAAENGAIVLSEVDNSREQSATDMASGENTQDKLFLLSSAEVEKYFPEKEDRTCKCTAYAEKNGAYVHERSGNTLWWTRSPGRNLSTASIVNNEGGQSHYLVTQKCGAVRPALWLDTAKLG